MGNEGSRCPAQVTTGGTDLSAMTQDSQVLSLQAPSHVLPSYPTTLGTVLTPAPDFGVALTG